MEAPIFISYRREDAPGHAGRLYDLLAGQVGSDRVFMDIDSIAPGSDFPEEIRRSVEASVLTLVVIGPRWLNAANDAGKLRLENPDDFVRIEVQTALECGVRVIPILVDGAVMPTRDALPKPLAALARRNAVELRDTRWRADVNRVVAVVDAVLAGAAPPERLHRIVGRKTLLAALTVCIVVIAWAIWSVRPDSWQSDAAAPPAPDPTSQRIGIKDLPADEVYLTPPRYQTLGLLEALERTAVPSLVVWVEGVTEEKLPLGQRMILHFRSLRDAYLTVLDIDSQGVMTILFPAKGNIEAGRIDAGLERTFPSPAAPNELEARLPLGPQTIFAIATAEPISFESLGIEATAEIPVLEPGEATRLAKLLVARIDGMPARSFSVSRADHTVVGDPHREDLVGYLEAHPTLSIPIQFEANSSLLSATSQLNLDVFSEALSDPELVEKTFVISGHTDQEGDAERNLVLSEQRAAAVRSYLISNGGIAPERLYARAMGESRPLSSGDTEEDHRINRRVEITLIP